MSSFISKPSSGWIHSDKLISKQGATYAVKYIGCLEVKASMKLLDIKTRSSIAKVCISRVSEAAGLKTVDNRRKIDKKVLRAIADEPKMDYAGTDVTLNISSSNLTLTSLDSGLVIASHDMPRVSFVSGGDSDTLDFVAYIAKDANEWRACYILECGGGLAIDVISTIGQAFKLRYQQHCKGNISVGLAMAQDVKDYYNDLPGKVPPDVPFPTGAFTSLNSASLSSTSSPPTSLMSTGLPSIPSTGLPVHSPGPPPVPPLPIVVPPLTTLPPVQTPNLIDLSSDVAPTEAHHHDYVNDSITFNRERDVFDMQPFTHQQPIAPSRKLNAQQLAELQSEIWYHGQISRAEAERLLLNDGDFLVRESPNTEGQYVLSGMLDNTKKHLLLIDPEGVVRTKDLMFSSVSHLITFHCKNALPLISAESALVLRVPVPRSS